MVLLHARRRPLVRLKRVQHQARHRAPEMPTIVGHIEHRPNNAIVIRLAIQPIDDLCVVRLSIAPALTQRQLAACRRSHVLLRRWAVLARPHLRISHPHIDRRQLHLLLDAHNLPRNLRATHPASNVSLARPPVPLGKSHQRPLGQPNLGIPLLRLQYRPLAHHVPADRERFGCPPVHSHDVCPVPGWFEVPYHMLPTLEHAECCPSHHIPVAVSQSLCPLC